MISSSLTTFNGLFELMNFSASADFFDFKVWIFSSIESSVINL
jgi:hypothetical protein